MALGKSRNNKRSSSNSYASTVTTVVFVVVCVLGAWLVTSNSSISPQKIIQTIDTDTDDSSSNIESHTSKLPMRSTTNSDNPVFEDNPGDLPTDAMKPDDDDSASTTTTTTHNDPEPTEIQKPGEEESTSNNDDKAEDIKTAENENADGGNKESDQVEASGHLEENPPGLKGKVSAEEEEKQMGHEIQISEENPMTHNQAVEEITTTVESHEKNSGSSEDHHQQRRHNDHQEENQDNGNSHVTQDHVSDEENEKRMESQQQQEEEQSSQSQTQSQQGGETSDDQVQHDEETPIESHSIAAETKAELENQENQHVTNLINQEKKLKEKDSKGDSFTVGEGSSGIPKESKESKKSWSTQADQSENQKERRQGGGGGAEADGSIYGYTWKLCNETARTDFIPCLDNEKAISRLHGRNHYEHRERHCPEEGPTCLVPVPEGYKTPIQWPKSRDKIWYHNVPHTTLAQVKGHQNWVKVTGEFLTFPGGGTQFIHGALHYIDFIQQAVPEIAWGKHIRVILDVGCGVASFGGFLFDKDVLTMSFAPKDEHEAQVQFALERGIPAISAVMGTQRLPFPSRVFDLVHCARCRVPWHIEGGTLLLELNRVLRPGGYFVWSATPVYQKLEEDVQIWKEMSALTVAMCWELVTIKRDKLNGVGAAIYHKPESNECYDGRKIQQPPMCKLDDDPNAAWYVPLQACMHRAPVAEAERGSQWPEEWPRRVQTPPHWLNKSQMGIYGKPAPDDFAADYEHWKWVVSKSYMSGLGISWSNVRNVMDMRAVYGGFAAAMKDLKVWVLNVVNIDSPDTLPIIFERGLFGIYHDWCESFSTYPRTYDLLHADHLFSRLKKRCKLAPVMAEVDRIVRPGGKLIVRDESKAIGEIENLLKSVHWEVHLTFTKNQEGILSAQKSTWRPDSYAPHS